jgi:hypothetical protein
MPQLVAHFKALLAPPCWPYLPIKRHVLLRANWEGWREWERECVQESGEKERAAMAAAIAAAVRAPKWAGSWVILLHVFVVILSLYISDNMDSPVDVGGFAEPRKTLSQCALPSVEQLSVHPRSAHGEPESLTT